MNCLRFPIRPSGALLVVATLGVVSSQVHADPVGLENAYRLVADYGPGGGEVFVDTGLVPSAGPLLNSDSISGSREGATDTASISVSSNYGSLFATGSGTATNSPTAGGGAAIDNPIGGQPTVQFQDYLNVTSSTLAVGTPVTIDFKASLGAFASEYNPLFPIPISFVDDGTVTDSKGFDHWNLMLTDNGTATYSLFTEVGDTVDIENGLHERYTNATDGLAAPPSLTADFNFTMSGTFEITSVTDGVDLVSGSGASYAPAGSVPDRASTAWLLAIGLAMVLFCSRSARVIVR